MPLYEESNPRAGIQDLPKRKECKVFFSAEECYFWPDNSMDWMDYVNYSLGPLQYFLVQVTMFFDENPSISKKKFNLEAAVFFMFIIYCSLKCR